MDKFEEVVNRHYSSEEERIKKLQNNKPIIESFWQSMCSTIQWLLEQEIRFYVFDMDLTTNTIWAGLRICCTHEDPISEEVRNKMTQTIIEKTQFKHIIWEL